MTGTRVAIVGLGAISFEHLAKLRRRAGVEIVGVCDLYPTLARAVGERFGRIPPYTDFERMLEETRPDVVHVLTPPQSHCELGLAALAAGAHLFVEKPITPTWEEYAQLRDRAAEQDLLICENYNYRFTPAVLAALDAWRAGEIGDVVNVDVSFGGVMGRGGPYADLDVVHFAHGLPGGALQNFATHPISLALPFMDECTAVLAARRRLAPSLASDDELRAILEGTRTSAVITVSANSSPAHLTLRVQGTRSTLDVDVYADQLRRSSEGSVIVGGLRAGVTQLRSSAELFGRALTGRRDPYAGLGILLDRFYAALDGAGDPPLAPIEMDAVNRVLGELFEPVAVA